MFRSCAFLVALLPSAARATVAPDEPGLLNPGRLSVDGILIFENVANCEFTARDDNGRIVPGSAAALELPDSNLGYYCSWRPNAAPTQPFSIVAQGLKVESTFDIVPDAASFGAHEFEPRVENPELSSFGGSRSSVCCEAIVFPTAEKLAPWDFDERSLQNLAPSPGCAWAGHLLQSEYSGFVAADSSGLASPYIYRVPGTSWVFAPRWIPSGGWGGLRGSSFEARDCILFERFDARDGSLESREVCVENPLASLPYFGTLPPEVCPIDSEDVGWCHVMDAYCTQDTPDRSSLDAEALGKRDAVCEKCRVTIENYVPPEPPAPEPPPTGGSRAPAGGCALHSEVSRSAAGWVVAVGLLIGVGVRRRRAA